MNTPAAAFDHSIQLGQTWIKCSSRGDVRGRIYINTAQLDGLNPELSRVDIRYLPSGRVRHLLLPQARKLLPQARKLLCKGWKLAGEVNAHG